MDELSLYEGVAQKGIDDPTGKVDIPLQKRSDGMNYIGASPGKRGFLFWFINLPSFLHPTVTITYWVNLLS